MEGGRYNHDDTNGDRARREAASDTAAVAAAAAAVNNDNDEPEPNYDHLDLSFEDMDDFTGTSARLVRCSDDDDENDEYNHHQSKESSVEENDVTCCKKTNKNQQWEEDDEEEDYILGTLIVRVVAARDLASVEHAGGLGKLLFGSGGSGGLRGGGGRSGSLHHKGSANPYASVRFGSTTQRTTEVYGTVDPVWPRGEAMYMDVTHPSYESLRAKKESTSKLVHHHDENQSPDPGDPPQKFISTAPPPVKADSTSSRSSAAACMDTAVYDHDSTQEKELARPPPPILTVAIFHADLHGKHSKFPSKGPMAGDSDDRFLGMIAVDLTPLLTGKIATFDEWLPLTGTESPRASVRIVCEYESSDTAPQKGDVVRFTGFCDPRDLYPANVNHLYVVEEADRDHVLISHTTTEGWVSTYAVHRFMLICEERHHGPMDFYQDELASITQRLAHSPMVHVVQDTVRRLPDDGFVDVAGSLVQGGVSLLSRWLEGGVETVVGDLTAATNWDGRFNPTAEESLSETPLEDEEPPESSSTAANLDEDTLPLSETLEESEQRHRRATAELLPNMPCCPITRDPMRDPVVAADGHTYERSAIVRWLKNSDKSPLTGSVLPHKNLVPNYMLLSSLRDAINMTVALPTVPTMATTEQHPSVSPSSILVETVTEEDSDYDELMSKVSID